MIPKRHNSLKIIKSSCGSVQSHGISVKKTLYLRTGYLSTFPHLAQKVLCNGRETLRQKISFRLSLAWQCLNVLVPALGLFPIIYFTLFNSQNKKMYSKEPHMENRPAHSQLGILVTSLLIRLFSIHPTSVSINISSSATPRPASAR